MTWRESGARRGDLGDRHINRNELAIRKTRRTLDFEQEWKK